jgi:hypothetical protein
MSAVRTWADGFGRWHAVVPDTAEGLTRAVEAIAGELLARAPKGETLEQFVAYVHEGLISVPDAEPGTVHFAEYALDL